MRKVGIIGFGSIGAVVAEALTNGDVPGGELTAVGRRHVRLGDALTSPSGVSIGTAVGVDELIGSCDIVVEAAGAGVLREHGAAIVESGADLVVVSSGALLDDGLRSSLLAGPNAHRVRVAAGAVGGLDIVRAAAAMGTIESARITTTKKPAGLVQDHMSEAERASLLALDQAKVLFEGGVRELVASFPSSTNVAASLALAVGSFELVQGRVVADPNTPRTQHVIELSGAAGEYRFEMTNHPSPTNPRSSGIVPWSVVCVLRELCASSWSSS
ncbi:MAG: aspartate dehydrogenase domain-containing protein [Actinomycetota bacterium]